MENGICTRVSKFTFDDAVQKLTDLLEEKGAKLFCIVDHSAEAESVGLKMLKTKLFIFGNARAGTPLMVETPTIALDLPLKLLVAETTEGTVTLSWNDPAWLRSRHGFNKQFVANLGAAASIAKALCL